MPDSQTSLEAKPQDLSLLGLLAGQIGRLIICFFFSSRRRHTSSLRDWSSDVCSSDLGAGQRPVGGLAPGLRPRPHGPARAAGVVRGGAAPGRRGPRAGGELGGADPAHRGGRRQAGGGARPQRRQLGGGDGGRGSGRHHVAGGAPRGHGPCAVRRGLQRPRGGARGLHGARAEGGSLVAAPRKTRAQLETAIRTNLDEISPSFWSAQDVPQYINRAKDRVAMEVRKVKGDYLEVTRTSLDGAVTILGEAYDTANFRTVPGITDYTLPPDFEEMAAMRCLTAGYEWLRFSFRRQTQGDFQAAQENISAQTPRYYTLLAERTWRIAAKPDATLDWELTYVAIVPDLTAPDSTLDLPHPLYMAVESYATGLALLKDHSQDAAAWEAAGNATMALFFGSTDRQSTDVEYVRAYLED